MPMPRSFGSSHVTFLPLMMMLPEETSSRPAMQLSNVDLPQPEGLTLADVEIERLQDDGRAETERQISDGNAGAGRIHAISPSPRPRRCRARTAFPTGNRRSAG